MCLVLMMMEVDEHSHYCCWYLDVVVAFVFDLMFEQKLGRFDGDENNKLLKIKKS